MRCCSASPQDTCAGRCTKTQPSPPTLHRVSEILHPAWLTAESQLEQHLQMRKKPCLYTQKKVFMMPDLINNKGPMATTWKDTNSVAPCWTQSDESGVASAAQIYLTCYHQTPDPARRSPDFTVSGPGGPRKARSLPGSLWIVVS